MTLMNIDNRHKQTFDTEAMLLAVRLIHNLKENARAEIDSPEGFKREMLWGPRCENIQEIYRIVTEDFGYVSFLMFPTGTVIDAYFAAASLDYYADMEQRQQNNEAA